MPDVPLPPTGHRSPAVSALATRTIAVASGKGGVGKSTVALNLAIALSQRGLRVGLLDLDIYGPDIPVMVGLTRRHPARSLEVWRAPRAGSRDGEQPVERFGIKVMSAQFLIAEDQSLTLDANLADLLVHRMAQGLAWGDLDHLVLDLPPGTADLQQVVARKLQPHGVVMVVTPQDVAHLDAKKAMAMFGRAGVAVLGAVENMAALVCPCCGERIDLFPPVAPERSIWADGLTKLASIPMQASVAAAAEAGEPIVLREPDGPVADAFRALADALHPPDTRGG